MFKKAAIFSLLIATSFIYSCKKKEDPTPANQAPTGKIEEYQWVGSYLTVKVTYADSDGRVNKVQLKIYKDGNLYSSGFPLTTDVASGEIKFANVIYAGTSGSYKIYADITDDKGTVTRTNALEEHVL